MLLLPGLSYAVDVEIIAVKSVFDKPPLNERINTYGVVLKSSPRALKSTQIKQFKRIRGELLYQLKVRVNGSIYYRLVLGNFSNRRLAQQRLNQVKGVYGDVWISKRLKTEKGLLIDRLKKEKRSAKIDKPVKVVKKDKKIAVPKVVKSTKTKRTNKKKPLSKNSRDPKILLKLARNEFFKHNYDEVISITDRVINIGNQVQQQQALELTGVSLERQRKFPQAVVLYLKFLDMYPESKFKTRIEARLQGLETMALEPNKKLTEKPGSAPWDIRGAFAQYYRDDKIDRSDLGNKSINTAFVTDFDIFARRKTAQNSMVLRFDGSYIDDRLEKEGDSRVSQALVSYTSNESGFRVTGGRQSRTSAGVYGRFDGLVFDWLSANSIDYSLYTGFLVQSSFDDVDSDRPFVGGSISFEFWDGYEMEVYLTQQKIDNLVDRQAIGTEIQKRFERGFVYSVLDYDVFYGDLNNATLITNYRMDDQWIFNISVDYRNSPLLTTANAIQGQLVGSVKELQNLYSNQQIYDLAEDRTSKSQNLLVSANYQIDSIRQLYMSLSSTSIDATEASAGVDANEASDDIHLAGDYSVRGYFFDDDFSTIGLRFSDTTSAETISIRTRSRIPGPGDIRYDPQVHLDFRTNKSSDDSQWILNSSLRMTYKYSKQINFEASLGIEYSNFDLPSLDDQTVYAIFVGYLYQF